MAEVTGNDTGVTDEWTREQRIRFLDRLWREVRTRNRYLPTGRRYHHGEYRLKPGFSEDEADRMARAEHVEKEKEYAIHHRLLGLKQGDEIPVDEAEIEWHRESEAEEREKAQARLRRRARRAVCMVMWPVIGGWHTRVGGAAPIPQAA